MASAQRLLLASASRRESLQLAYGAIPKALPQEPGLCGMQGWNRWSRRDTRQQFEKPPFAERSSTYPPDWFANHAHSSITSGMVKITEQQAAKLFRAKAIPIGPTVLSPKHSDAARALPSTWQKWVFTVTKLVRTKPHSSVQLPTTQKVVPYSRCIGTHRPQRGQDHSRRRLDHRQRRCLDVIAPYLTWRCGPPTRLLMVNHRQAHLTNW